MGIEFPIYEIPELRIQRLTRFAGRVPRRGEWSHPPVCDRTPLVGAISARSARVTIPNLRRRDTLRYSTIDMSVLACDGGMTTTGETEPTMPTLPWTAPKRSRPPAGELTVMASRFQLRQRRDVAPFLLAAVRIRRQMLRSPGVVGVSLIAKPLAKTFYTLSAWEDRDSLNSAVAQQPHLRVMERFRSRTEGSLFVFWSVPASQSRPDWDDAHRRLEDEASKAPHY